MAKSIKKKDAKTASNTFHNIMAASVKGNPKPVESNIGKLFQYMQDIQSEIAQAVADGNKYLTMQVGEPNKLFYSIKGNCPEAVANEMKSIILENAVRLNLAVNTTNNLAD